MRYVWFILICWPLLGCNQVHEFARTVAVARTLDLAIRRKDQRQYSESLRLAKRVLDLEPSHPVALRIGAVNAFATGRIAEGQRYFSQSDIGNFERDEILLISQSLETRGQRRWEMARRMRSQGMLEIAIREVITSTNILKAALRKNPDDWWIENALAYILADNGFELQKAKQLALKALQHLDEAHANPLVKMTRSVIPEANGLTYSELRGEVLDTVGWAYYRTHDLQQAERYLSEAVEHYQMRPEIRFHLAKIYLDLKKEDLAIREFERCLEISPQYLPAKQELQKLGRDHTVDESDWKRLLMDYR